MTAKDKRINTIMQYRWIGTFDLTERLCSLRKHPFCTYPHLAWDSSKQWRQDLDETAPAHSCQEISYLIPWDPELIPWHLELYLSLHSISTFCHPDAGWLTCHQFDENSFSGGALTHWLQLLRSDLCIFTRYLLCTPPPKWLIYIYTIPCVSLAVLLIKVWFLWKLTEEKVYSQKAKTALLTPGLER